MIRGLERKIIFDSHFVVEPLLYLRYDASVMVASVVRNTAEALKTNKP